MATAPFQMFVLSLMMFYKTSLAAKIPTFAGPYIAYLDNVEQCPPDVPNQSEIHIRGSHFVPTRPFDKQRLVGNFTLPMGMDDGLMFTAVLDSWSNNQWKENAFVFNFPGNACAALRQHMPGFYKVAFNNVTKKLPSSGPCTIPPGLYIVDGLVSWDFPYFPVMPYGHYRLRCRAHRPGQLKNPIYCIYVICTAIPKPK